MPSFNIQELIGSLQQNVRETLLQLETIQQIPADVLLQQPEPGKWSIAQVLEHLNGYNRFYLAAIEKALNNSAKPSRTYKAGWFGEYFTRLMQPKPDGTLAKKMSAPTAYNFGPELDPAKVISEFRNGQQQLLVLLDRARTADLGCIKVPISISKLIKLKLGDVFRFLIAHQQRHFLQIDRVRGVVA
ncbi:MAG: DinB family protein [Taibaiella sp.]|nr:DinB family protein [Taibaiella sp.]